MIKSLLNTHLFNLILAIRNLSRQKRRSLISISAVAFGITALVISSGFIEWIFHDFRETSIRSQLGHLQIVLPNYHELGKSDPYAYLLPENLPIVQTNFKSGKIKTIVPRISFSGLISNGESTISFIGEGVNPQEHITFGNALQISEGGYLSSDLPKQIIVGEGLARNLGINVGDQVIIMANTTSGGINAIEVIVGGLFSTVTKSYDDNAIRIPIETARQLLRTEGTHSWIVLLDDTKYTDNVLTELRNSLPADKFEIVPWYALADFYNKTVVLFSKQVTAIKMIIAAIILLSIFNTMSISVMERISEIGTAMALGVKRMNIIRLFISEGIMIGCVGGIVGLTISLLLASIISHFGIPMPPPPGMARGYTGEILVTAEIAIESLLIAFATAIIASIFPAWKASRMQIVDALRRSR